MEACDRAFEYSDVEATIKGHIDSIKNPRSGSISCDSLGKLIKGQTVMPCDTKVIVGGVLQA